MQYAKNKSDVHAKKDGDFDEHYSERMKRKGTIVYRINDMGNEYAKYGIF